MFFGETPSFDEIMETVRKFEKTFNATACGALSSSP